MRHIRTIRTKGNSRSVQVFYYRNGNRVIVKHIGSGTTEKEIFALNEMAKLFIADTTKQLYLFEDFMPVDNDVLVSQCDYIGFYYTYLYNILRAVQHKLGHIMEVDSLLSDLVIIRILEPASKLPSITLMEIYFGIKHRRQRFYESAPRWIYLRKAIEKQTLSFAKKQYNFDLSLMFYDVTTFYFETFTEEELRKNGFLRTTNSNNLRS